MNCRVRSPDRTIPGGTTEAYRRSGLLANGLTLICEGHTRTRFNEKQLHGRAKRAAVELMIQRETTQPRQGWTGGKRKADVAPDAQRAERREFSKGFRRIRFSKRQRKDFICTLEADAADELARRLPHGLLLLTLAIAQVALIAVWLASLWPNRQHQRRQKSAKLNCQQKGQMVALTQDAALANRLPDKGATNANKRIRSASAYRSELPLPHASRQQEKQH